MALLLGPRLRISSAQASGQWCRMRYCGTPLDPAFPDCSASYIQSPFSAGFFRFVYSLISPGVCVGIHWLVLVRGRRHQSVEGLCDAPHRADPAARDLDSPYHYHTTHDRFEEEAKKGRFAKFLWVVRHAPVNCAPCDTWWRYKLGMSSRCRPRRPRCRPRCRPRRPWCRTNPPRSQLVCYCNFRSYLVLRLNARGSLFLAGC